MGKLLLFSGLLFSLIIFTCKGQKKGNYLIDTQKVDSIHIHKAPNQLQIDSIKLLKTEKKLKKKKKNHN